MTSFPRNGSEDLKALSALAAASHDVRGALAAIISHAELLAERAGDPQQSRSTALLIERHGRAVLETFDAILRTARDQGDAPRARPAPCDLRSMIEELVLLHTPRAVKAGLVLESSIDARLPDRVNLDRSAVHRILSNLIENALKYTVDGGVRVHARLTIPGDLVIEVEDTGIGIESSDAQRIFEPFVRSDDSRRSGIDGVGLGLSLCRDLARAMNADLMVEAAGDGGSIFRLVIDGQARRASSGDASLEGLRFLLVDDCDETLRLLSTILESNGALVTSTSDTRDLASRIVESGGEPRFDLILLDLEMPVRDGWSVQRILRENGCPIPVAGLTAHEIEPLKARAHQLGFTGLLGKPLVLKSLEDLVERCLRRGPARLAG